MRNKKFYEWLLPISYVAMVLLCVVLNLFTGQQEDMASLAVNIVMFLIVAVIFIACDVNCFAPMGGIAAELESMTEKIRKDAMNSHEYLWDTYSKSGAGLFTNGRLKEAYEDYLFELNRNEEDGDAYYKCSIADYINTGLVDTVMHRNQLNQVAGALTGLGILGTFIGLSMGLQQFNTGSTAEITSSVEPLMNGIKVAFHTSIYGMVFSLVFNYVYKRKLYDSEQAVEKFVSTWEKFVVPNTSRDGTNRMLEIQEETLKAVSGIAKNLGDELAAQLTPGFERVEKVIGDFTRVASEEQREALQRVVTAFIAEMNTSCGQSLSRFGAAVDEQTRLCRNTAQAVDRYYEKACRVEDEMQKNILSLNMQNESNTQMLLKAKDEFKEVVDACDDATDAADELRLVLENGKKNRR